MVMKIVPLRKAAAVTTGGARSAKTKREKNRNVREVATTQTASQRTIAPAMRATVSAQTGRKERTSKRLRKVPRASRRKPNLAAAAAAAKT